MVFTAVVVFIHSAARLEVGSTPLPVTTPVKLARHLPKNWPKLPGEQYQRIRMMLGSV